LQQWLVLVGLDQPVQAVTVALGLTHLLMDQPVLVVVVQHLGAVPPDGMVVPGVVVLACLAVATTPVVLVIPPQQVQFKVMMVAVLTVVGMGVVLGVVLGVLVHLLTQVESAHPEVMEVLVALDYQTVLQEVLSFMLVVAEAVAEVVVLRVLEETVGVVLAVMFLEPPILAVVAVVARVVLLVEQVDQA